MNDKELLELAAKAAGATWIDACWPEDLPGLMLDFGNGTHQWNPLTNDGDALRLAVKVGLSDAAGLVLYFADTDDETVVMQDFGDRVQVLEVVESDTYAATRRAIVRAAAEIGGMK